MAKGKGKKKTQGFVTAKTIGYSDATRKVNRMKRLRTHLNALMKKKEKLEAKGISHKIDRAIEEVEGLLTT